MSEPLAEVIVAVLGAYAAAGVVFALVFAVWGVNRIDHVAREGTPGFRLIILPGAAALWPLLAARWLRTRA